MKSGYKPLVSFVVPRVLRVTQKLEHKDHNVNTKNTMKSGYKPLVSFVVPRVLRVTQLLFFLLFLPACQSEIKRPIDKDVLTETEVRDFISRYDEGWATRDTILLKDLMDERYIYFSSTGATLDRPAIISWFNPADKYIVDTANRSEIHLVQLKGSTAIISSRWTGSGIFGAERFQDDQRCALVIQKQDGQLKLLSEHCTQIVK